VDISLILIGLLGGLVTGISPCILPVLPVIFFSGGVQAARGEEGARPVSRWRPYLVILGLVVSFSLVTLVGSLLLALLGLPQDVLRWAGIVVLVIIGVGLIVPQFQHILEKPFSWIPQKAVGTDRGGFGLGLALGAVYVPCAGPVLAAITVAGSTGRIGADTVALTLSFAIGAAVPLLIFALAGRGVAERVKAFRRRQQTIRVIGGVTMIALAVGLVFNVPAALQRLVPDYTAGIQEQIAESDQVREALDLGNLVTEENAELDNCTNGASELESCGTAPSLRGLTSWFNTPGDDELTLDELRGEVVLIDFWAYSCINCQRSIPHAVAWDEAYRDVGLNVIGIHSPEYAFEKEERNVRAGAADFGIDYPVALDNNLSTWTNYRNRYWPAHYLIDAEGVVRHVKLGEGGYATTEKLIRELLVQANPDVQLPPPTETEDETPEFGETTVETYLQAGKVQNYGGEGRYGAGEEQRFVFPAQQPRNSFALRGTWTINTQNASPDYSPGRIRLDYTAREIRMVLAGEGEITLLINGEPRVIDVSGTPRSYQLAEFDELTEGTLEVVVTPGVQAYSFTFG